MSTPSSAGVDPSALIGLVLVIAVLFAGVKRRVRTDDARDVFADPTGMRPARQRAQLGTTARRPVRAVPSALRRAASLVGYGALGLLAVALSVVALPVHQAEASTYSSTILGDSPVAYYRLDESSGSTAADSSGNGYGATYSGSGVTYSATGAIHGDTDTAVTATGTAAMYSGSALPTSAGAARTVEAWFKTTAGGSYQGIVSQGATNRFDVLLNYGDPDVVFDSAGVELHGSVSAPLDDGAWHYIAVTYDSGVLSLYADGQLVATQSSVTDSGTNPDLYIGSDGANVLDGSVDDVAVYSTALSESQIGAHWSAGMGVSCPATPGSGYAGAVAGDSPLRYFRLGESTGTVAADSSGHCSPAVYTADASHVTGGILGSGDGAVSGTPGPWVAAAGGSLPTASGAARSVEAWFKTTTSPTFQTIASQGTSQRFDLLVHGSSVAIYFDSAGVDLEGTIPYGIDDGTWHYIVATYGSGTLSLYLDGQLIAHQDSVTDSGTSTGPFLIGSDGANPFTGSIDDVAVYNTALSQSQITDHWRAAEGSSCPGTPASGYAAAVDANSPTRFFPLGEQHGALALDDSGNCAPAAYEPGAAHTPHGALVTSTSGAATATGSSRVAYASGSALPTSANASRTIDAWIRTTAGPTYQSIASQGNSVGGRFDLLLFGGRPSVVIDTAGAEVDAPSTDVIDDGQWHYVAVTYGSGTVKLYTDGELSQTQSSITDSGTNDEAFVIGQDDANTFTGDIADVAIYPTALSAGDIAAHYSAGAPEGVAVKPQERLQSNAASPCDGRSQSTGSGGDPVSTATGEFSEDFTDLSVPGRGFPLDVRRTYSSLLASSDGPFGYGWQGEYGANIAVTGTSPNEVATLTQENGSQIEFDQPATGSVWTPEAPRWVATLTLNMGGDWTFVRKCQETMSFDSSGNLTSMTDLNGYTTTLSYLTGKLATVTDEAGRSLGFSWTGSHITGVTDANVSPSRTVAYGYDGSGNLTTFTDVNGNDWDYTYDGSHRMLTIADPRCLADTAHCHDDGSGDYGVQNHYDGSGRVDWQKDDMGRETDFAYNSDGSTLTTNPVGNEQMDYYTDGVRTAVTVGYGTADAATAYFTYDPATLALASETDADGHTTTFTVDSSGNVLTAADPMGHVTTATYNGFNEPLTVEDGNGVTTTNTYDGNGNLVTTSTPLVGAAGTATNCKSPVTAVAIAQVTCYAYGDMSHPGDVTSTTDPDGKTTPMTYDSYGDLASTTDPNGLETTSTYNADGWKLTDVSSAGNVMGCSCVAAHTTTYGYGSDKFGDVLTVTDPLTHVVTYTYDPDRAKASFEDADGNTTSYVDDLDGEPTEVQRADSSNIDTTYNDDGTIHEQKDAAGHALQTYAYDHQGRPISVTDALSNESDVTYDPAGNVTRRQDPGGDCGTFSGCTTYSYNDDNLLTGIDYSDSATPDVASITYDDDNQRTGMTDGTGSSTWAYDSLHRLTSYDDGHGDTIGYQYNLRNEPTTITYPGSHDVTETYDDGGRWLTTEDWNSKTTTYGYDDDSNLHTETMPTSGTSVIDTFDYNNADQLTSISSDQGGTNIWGATYGRDDNGQLTSDNSATTNQTSYKYNALNQTCYAGSGTTNACGSPPGSSQPFAFDSADNLTTFGGTQQKFNNADELCWTYSGTSANACASTPSGGTTYNYDTKGNRTSEVPSSGPATCDSYDQANRLTEIQTGTGSSCTSPTTVATYGYNGDGLRMSKDVGGTTTQQTWDASGSLPLLIKDGSTYYVYGPGGMPLEQIGGSTLWYHHDQIGSTRAITDSSGVMKATYTFDPYGNVSACTGATVTVNGSNACTGSITVSNPMLYAGQSRDDESNLYYLRARYYAPSIAQFVTLDPMVAATGAPYGYAGAAPINSADPSGMIDPDQLSQDQKNQIDNECSSWQRSDICRDAGFCSGDACHEVAQIAGDNYKILETAIGQCHDGEVTFNGYTETYAQAQTDLGEEAAAYRVARAEIDYENGLPINALPAIPADPSEPFIWRALGCIGDTGAGISAIGAGPALIAAGSAAGGPAGGAIAAPYGAGMSIGGVQLLRVGLGECGA